MSAIRVLVVDDAAVVRRLVASILNHEPDIEVVDVATNGREALAKLDRIEVDVVTLDVEMPEMDGLETLSAIRQRWRRLPVIMFSTLTERGKAVTLDALVRGASDYITKPTNTGALAASLEEIRRELLPRVRALGGRLPVRATPRPAAGRPAEGRPADARPGRPARPAAPAARTVGRATRPDAVVVGVSTGGPNALAEIIPQLPHDFDVPVLVVQHMPPTFTRLLAERLDSRSELTVVEVDRPVRVVAGGVYVACGGRHMVVTRRGTDVWAEPDDGPPEQSCRPAVNVLFRSATRLWGERLLAVILTGMGQDGLDGCRDVRAAGGQVVVQDRDSCVVWGMPKHVEEAGLADAALPLNEVAGALVTRCRRTSRAGVA